VSLWSCLGGHEDAWQFYVRYRIRIWFILRYVKPYLCVVHITFGGSVANWEKSDPLFQIRGTIYTLRGYRLSSWTERSYRYNFLYELSYLCIRKLKFVIFSVSNVYSLFYKSLQYVQGIYYNNYSYYFYNIRYWWKML